MRKYEEDKVNLSMAMFEALESLDGLYAIQGGGSVPPDSVVAAVVRGYMAAFEKLANEQPAPAEPKQRRARRKTSDIVAANAALDAIANAEGGHHA